MELGEKLKMLRKSRFLSQFELATALDISQNAVSQYELGVRQPSMPVLKKYAAYFNTTISAMMPSDGVADHEFVQQVADCITQNPKLGKLFELAIHMSDQELNAILAVAIAMSKGITDNETEIQR